MIGSHDFQIMLQVLHDSNVPQEALDASLKEKLARAEKSRAYNEDVASVLLVSLQDEAHRLRSEVKSKDSHLEALNRRQAGCTA